MTSQPITGRCPVAHGFDAMSDDYYRDPASHIAEAREEHPVFFYPYLGAWIVTRREDAETVLGDWQAFSSAANSATIDVPERYREIMPPELISQMLVGSDPPSHTVHRSVAQRGFTKDRMQALQPEIEARAHRIIDKFETRGAGELVQDFCLELTTQTIMAHLGLSYRDDPLMRQLRDDFFRVLASAQEPLEEPERSQVWDRFIEANLHLRAIVDERRDNPGTDLISDMASVRDTDGAPALSTAQITLHLAEFAAAGTDTTAQAMANAVLFLDANPGALAEALADPDLWPRVFEETVRRRPSSTFASRQTQRDVELGGVHIRQGEMIWIALAGANTDPAWAEDPFAFDIHRPDPEGHLSFTQGRHTCLGQSLARVQGATGLQVLFDRLPSLRPQPDFELDFVRMALLPVRRSLPVTWDPADAERQRHRVMRRRTLEVVERRTESDGVVSLTLAHPDGDPLPQWSPGAHVDVHTPEGPVRQYSLSSAPERTDRWRIGVLRESDSRGGSRSLHEAAIEGATLTVGWPRNNFPLREASRYLFVAGGIGITPILPMIEQAEASGADWQLLYGGRCRSSMAFLGELARYGDRVVVRPEDEYGLLDLDGWFGQPAEDTLLYCCGPEPLLQAAERASAHWPTGALHIERFSPKTIVRSEPDEEFEVEFTESGVTATVPAGRTILEVAEQAGVTTLSSCKEGTCGTCETPIRDGRADHRDSILTGTEQQANTSMMICVSRAEKGCPKLTLER
ncbi:cytochrome P450 [Halopolyspora algeriensis]|uniref:Cytochrome P450 n=1 Tax=Halopolyspora algeriensis TaxID=1500506 RepID=A0A368VEU6_9ACTN|nr:cytochrome P450 [Halopolyspora algeriensis]RCW39668.1 cytochrome P450 [Halopolyspora algeriensis]TQM54039.1 cytochrome P450 [Halopolyspora algeriensis]